MVNEKILDAMTIFTDISAVRQLATLEMERTSCIGVDIPTSESSVIEETNMATQTNKGSEGDTKTKGLPSINTVTSSEFHAMHVPGFTESRINAVLDYRDKHGAFESMDAIEKVPMIGPTMVESLKEHFSI